MYIIWMALRDAQSDGRSRDEDGSWKVAGMREAVRVVNK
jgi:hypothetical protein